MMEMKNFIGGEWCDAISGKTRDRTNPANLTETVGRSPDSDGADAKKAIEVAHEAFLHWREGRAPQRALVLRRAIDLMAENLERFARDLTLEQGKPLREARAEIKFSLEEAEYMVGEGTRIEGRHIPSARPGTVCYTTREPIGVVCAITPWNFPFIIAMRKVAPAVVFGDTIVLKSALLTPFSCANIVRCFAEAGLPPGVLNLVVGSGDSLGSELVGNPHIRGISFTGSTTVGLKIAGAAAANNIKLQMEMGGKNPAVVFDGADLQKAAREIVPGALTCAGQRCVSISRVIVQKSIASELIALLMAEIGNVVVGDGMDETTTMGPLVSEHHLLNVLGYVEQGVKEGATVAMGGKRLTGPKYDKGAFMEPTLMTNVRPDSTLALEEVFGPVLSVIEFSDFDEAIEIANAVSYGLAACCYTPRVDQALAFVDRVQAGMTQVNMPTYIDHHAPFGGVKASGQGAFSVGYSCVDFFTNQKTVYIQG